MVFKPRGEFAWVRDFSLVEFSKVFVSLILIFKGGGAIGEVNDCLILTLEPYLVSGVVLH